MQIVLISQHHRVLSPYAMMQINALTRTLEVYAFAGLGLGI